jgi:hypothetical protein
MTFKTVLFCGYQNSRSLSKERNIDQPNIWCKLVFNSVKLRLTRSNPGDLLEYNAFQSQHKSWDQIVKHRNIIPDSPTQQYGKLCLHRAAPSRGRLKTGPCRATLHHARFQGNDLLTDFSRANVHNIGRNACGLLPCNRQRNNATTLARIWLAQLNYIATVFGGCRAEELSWRPSAIQSRSRQKTVTESSYVKKMQRANWRFYLKCEYVKTSRM